MFARGRAKTGQFATGAIRVPREATAASVPNKQVTPQRPRITRNHAHEVLFDFDRIAMFGQPEALAQPSHVRVDDHARIDSVGIAQDDVRCFPSDPRQDSQGIKFPGHLALIIFDERSRRGSDIFRFVPVESRRSDEILEVIWRSLGHAESIRVFGKQSGRDHVHPHVGALRGENRGDEEFERIAVHQFAVRVGIGSAQQALEVRGALSAGHVIEVRVL